MRLDGAGIVSGSLLRGGTHVPMDRLRVAMSVLRPVSGSARRVSTLVVRQASRVQVRERGGDTAHYQGGGQNHAGNPVDHNPILTGAPAPVNHARRNGRPWSTTHEDESPAPA